MKRKLSFPFVLFFCFLCALQSLAQGLNTVTLADGRKANSIKTAVPFLTISPDAKAGAMGDVGAATSPDVYSLHWNPAKLAFLEKSSGISLSYSPWLKNIVPDIDFAYLTYYQQAGERNRIGASLRYFSLGNIQLTDAEQNDLGTYSPSELALDVAFARQFGNNFSLGTAIRYISSNLSNGQFYSGELLRPASAFSADISAYFNTEILFFGNESALSFGLNLSNIGTKISYARGGSKYFLPGNMRLGSALNLRLKNTDRLTFALDMNKLLVPTTPEYDSNGNIVNGRDPDRSVVSGIFGSFVDAPGGFAEELQEISYSFGTEYLFNQQFALRAGFFYENPQKGDRQFVTLGSGFQTGRYSIDFAYILASQAKSPLANTLRFSLAYQLEKSDKIKFK
jgi:hypothetical protein